MSEKWTMFKNYLHNVLGVSKDDVENWVREEARKIANIDCRDWRHALQEKLRYNKSEITDYGCIYVYQKSDLCGFPKWFWFYIYSFDRDVLVHSSRGKHYLSLRPRRAKNQQLSYEETLKWIDVNEI